MMIKLQKLPAFKTGKKKNLLTRFIKKNTLFDKVVFCICVFLFFLASFFFTYIHFHILQFESSVINADNLIKVYDFQDALKKVLSLHSEFLWEQSIYSNKLQTISFERKAHAEYLNGLDALYANNYNQAVQNFSTVSISSQDYINASSERKRAENISNEELTIQNKFQDALKHASEEVNNGQQQLAEGDFALAYQIAISDRVLSLQTETLLSINNNLDNLKTQIERAQDIAKQDMVKEASINRLQGPKITSLRVPILMYHYIRDNPDPNDILGYNLSVTPVEFDKQMHYLSDNQYNTITMLDLVNALKNTTPLPKKSIILTFDDGYTDFYTNAFPILKKYNLKAENYVISGFIDHYRYLSSSQIKEMYQSGLITIGSHSVDHPDLRTLTNDTLHKEMIDSKNTLEKLLATTITDFCYPFGYYNESVKESVEEAGYIDATTTQESAIHTSNNHSLMPRVRMSGGMSLAQFIQRL